MSDLDDAVAMIRQGMDILREHDVTYNERGGVPLFRVGTGYLAYGLHDIEKTLAAVRVAEAKTPTLFDLDAPSPFARVVEVKA